MINQRRHLSILSASQKKILRDTLPESKAKLNRMIMSSEWLMMSHLISRWWTIKTCKLSICSVYPLICTTVTHKGLARTFNLLSLTSYSRRWEMTPTAFLETSQLVKQSPPTILTTRNPSMRLWGTKMKPDWEPLWLSTFRKLLSRGSSRIKRILVSKNRKDFNKLKFYWDVFKTWKWSTRLYF